MRSTWPTPTERSSCPVDGAGRLVALAGGLVVPGLDPVGRADEVVLEAVAAVGEGADGVEQARLQPQDEAAHHEDEKAAQHEAWTAHRHFLSIDTAPQ